MSRRLLVALLLYLPVLALACSKSDDAGKAKAAARPPAVAVTAAPVEIRDVPVQIQAIGNVQPAATVSVYSLVGGQIFKVHFKEGQDVKANDVLFSMDPRPFEAALAQAQATMGQHQAQVAQAEANLVRDQAQYENARVGEERYRRLVEGGFVAREQYDQYATTLKTAQATVDADRAALANAKALVQADAAMVENAKVQLSYTTIRAPIAGRT
ncbi:MAG: efflux RND transporter periplasmic adaptor subunit, partial [Candidatus Rokuibacteriota bacterium]